MNKISSQLQQFMHLFCLWYHKVSIPQFFYFSKLYYLFIMFQLFWAICRAPGVWVSGQTALFKFTSQSELLSFFLTLFFVIYKARGFAFRNMILIHTKTFSTLQQEVKLQKRKKKKNAQENSTPSSLFNLTNLIVFSFSFLQFSVSFFCCATSPFPRSLSPSQQPSEVKLMLRLIPPPSLSVKNELTRPSCDSPPLQNFILPGISSNLLNCNKNSWQPHRTALQERNKQCLKLDLCGVGQSGGHMTAIHPNNPSDCWRRFSLEIRRQSSESYVQSNILTKYITEKKNNLGGTVM